MLRLIQRALAAFALLAWAVAANAGTDTYEYDALGRLKKWTDSQGRITEYIYDAVGNIREVKPGAGSTALAPTISGVTPNLVRRGTVAQVTVAGTNLAGATITTAASSLTVSSISSAPTSVNFTLTTGSSAALGAQSFQLSTAAGTKTFSIQVAQPLPTLLVSPSPIAIPVDPVEKRIFIRLSAQDVVDRVLALSTADPSVATVTPSTVTIPAGQTEVEVRIRGVANGITQFSVVSAGLATAVIPLYVTTEFGGINVASAPLLGVNLLGGDGGGGTSVTGDAQSALLGVAYGRFVSGIAPSRVSNNAGSVTLTVSGDGLNTATGLEIVPSDGLTVSAFQAAPNGKSLTATVSVAPTAPTSIRRVHVLGPDSYSPVSPDSDRLLVTLPIPEILAIEPINAIPGTSGINFRVYGRNLTGATAVTFDPPTGIVVGASPVVESGGTILTVGVSVALNAATGPRTVMVTSPAGNSDAAASLANTFTIGTEVTTSVPSIVAPVVGVMLGAEPPPPAGQSFESSAPAVGVAYGLAAISIAPKARSAGENFTLVVTGVGLQGVNAVEFSPAQGITVGSVTPSPDGSSVMIAITLAADAERSARLVNIRAGTQRIAFPSVEASQFIVTGPTPLITSVAPLLLQVGTQTTLTVSGTNFQDVSSVQLEPSTGISYGLVSINANGTGVSVPVLVAADAPTGPRVVRLSTPAVTTSSSPELGNTVTVYSGTAISVDPVIAPSLGIVLQSSGSANTTQIEPIVSPVLGVVLQSGTTTPPVSTTFEAYSPSLGVAFGAIATGVSQTPLNLGSSGSITLQGINLAGVTSVSVNPSTGLTTGALSIAPDGSSVTVPVTVDAGAAVGQRQITALAGASSVSFASGVLPVFYVTTQAPAISSIEPIVLARGNSVELLVRGTNLNFASAVSVTPANGVEIVSSPAVNAAGTELRISISVSPTASTGSRVVQIIAPGGTSSPTPSPSNTLNIN